jgi:hypothetical protein
MFKRIIPSAVLLCTIILLLTACGQTSTPIPTEVIQPTAAPIGEYQPIDEAECTALQQELAAVLGIEVNRGPSPFEDYATGGSGTCCLLKATATGVEFPNELGLVASLQFFLEDQGWVLDIGYAAGGPTGTAFGLRKDGSLALVSVMWTPSADASCPADQPISACNLEPGQILYTIRVQLAKK